MEKSPVLVTATTCTICHAELVLQSADSSKLNNNDPSESALGAADSRLASRVKPTAKTIVMIQTATAAGFTSCSLTAAGNTTIRRRGDPRAADSARSRATLRFSEFEPRSISSGQMIT